MFRIIPYELEDSTVLIPRQSQLFLDIPAQQSMAIKYGIESLQATIKQSNIIDETTIFMSTDIIQTLHIPLSSEFFVRFKENEFVLGPYIGIMAEVTNEKLSALIPTLTTFLRSYAEIGGTILAFSLEGVNQLEHRITGYIYHPETNTWKHGVYTYPAATLSITEASLTTKWRHFRQTMHHFHSLLGNSIFNYPTFSKWDMYEMLKSKYASVLPETILYQSSQDLKMMLEKHRTVFVKPIHGRLGMSVYKVAKLGDGIRVQYYGKKKLVDKWIQNERAFYAALYKKLGEGHYLIQEPISLMQQNNSVIDFRVMIAKNSSGIWEHCGIFARSGKTGNIVSNITAGGQAEAAEITLKEVWNLRRREIIKLKSDIFSLCNEIVQTIETKGFHCGNIGIDIGIEKDLSLWIIEINNQNPDPYIAKMARQSKYFYQSRLLNMQYAKRLAGF